LIDLHVHTTASDGVLAPAAVVARAQRAGITVLSVTDHDTTAGLEEARAAARTANIRLVDGIEITAVERDRDVHVLGYFFDPDDLRLAEFLAGQRADRVRRVHEIVTRLASAGCAIDARPIFEAASTGGRSIGRPHIADALVAAGHARDRNDAFDRLLGAHGCAFVARRGPTAAEVVGVIRDAGGVASLAHPGLTQRDDLIPALARAGLAAIEARHADHDAETEARYRVIAAAHDLAVTGGSDFHAEGDHHEGTLGSVALAPEDFAALQARLPVGLASPKPRSGEGGPA
jgi:3',5'-nucleoside bisphosphate phosphatase